MTIRVILPAALQQDQAPPPLQSHVHRRLPAAPVLGLIDNGKTKADKILDAIGRRLIQRGLVSSSFMLRKPSAGIAITESERAQMLARAHFIVSGIGD
jgi:hypothetical protein